MIGIYNYTVWLTYMSFLSASIGIFVTLAADRPLLGVFCLLFSGLCDAFDGKVASTKKDRTSFDKKYGIQIDSLSDVVAFGVLPAAIGIQIYKGSRFAGGLENTASVINIVVSVVVLISFLMYCLAAMIRLAFFNVTEDERQQVETGARAHYSGLPVTSAALVFPLIFFLRRASENVFVIVYFAVMVLMSFAFLMNIKIRKPGLKGVIFLTIAGLVEFILIVVFILCLKVC